MGELDGREWSPLGAKRKLLGLALVALMVVPQCCCCVVPLGLSGGAIPLLPRARLHPVRTVSASRAVALARPVSHKLP
jgi:hypothetical protein